MTHDPGGKTRLQLQPDITRHNAVFSPDGVYRHALWRFWTHERRPRIALWIGMNPSTADDQCDDPTVRREIDFSRAWGYRAYCKVNVMDYRATSPADLRKPGVRPCSDSNMWYISTLAQRADIHIAAWGRIAKPLKTFATSVALALNEHQLWCVGVNQDGSPKHPLYLKADTALRVWR
jgi:hypothetical protein